MGMINLKIPRATKQQVKIRHYNQDQMKNNKYQKSKWDNLNNRQVLSSLMMRRLLQVVKVIILVRKEQKSRKDKR